MGPEGFILIRQLTDEGHEIRIYNLYFNDRYEIQRF